MGAQGLTIRFVTIDKSVISSLRPPAAHSKSRILSVLAWVFFGVEMLGREGELCCGLCFVISERDGIYGELTKHTERKLTFLTE